MNRMKWNEPRTRRPGGRLFGLCMSLAAAASVAALGGCLAGGGGDGAATSANGESHARALAADTRPIEAGSATLLVQGLSCPKCANNVDLALAKVRGVDSAAIDMGAGVVKVRFHDGEAHPSRADLAAAIDRTGFTLTEIRVP